MFLKEFNIMCVKWNAGKLYGYHFNTCSHIINYLDDKHLFAIYHGLINKWNNGQINGCDFDLLNNYLNKIVI